MSELLRPPRDGEPKTNPTGDDGTTGFVAAAFDKVASDLSTITRQRDEAVRLLEEVRAFTATTLYPEAIFRLADTLDRSGVDLNAVEMLRMLAHNEQVVCDRLAALSLATVEDKP